MLTTGRAPTLTLTASSGRGPLTVTGTTGQSFTVPGRRGTLTIGRGGGLDLDTAVGAIAYQPVRVGYDTDGAPYYGAPGPDSVPIRYDTDGVPYLASSGASILLAYDVDGVPYLAA